MSREKSRRTDDFESADIGEEVADGSIGGLLCGMRVMLGLNASEAVVVIGAVCGGGGVCGAIGGLAVAGATHDCEWEKKTGMKSGSVGGGSGYLKAGIAR